MGVGAKVAVGMGVAVGIGVGVAVGTAIARVNGCASIKTALLASNACATKVKVPSSVMLTVVCH